MADDEPSERELLWREYNLHIELYKYYMDIALKTNSFFYLITGGIVSFCVANTDRPLVRLALILPVIMSVALAFGFFYSALLSTRGRRQIFAIANKIGLRELVGLSTAIEVKILTFSLWAFGAVFILVALVLVCLAVWLPRPAQIGI